LRRFYSRNSLKEKYPALSRNANGDAKKSQMRSSNHGGKRGRMAALEEALAKTALFRMKVQH
jgi:hypothetical protein